MGVGVGVGVGVGEGDAEGSASVDAEEWKEREYDRLADLVRRSVDMEKIYEILNRGI